ncbi:hypothetical protein OK016_21135 [Vibrio chagasii]|nr:hypothetical protein [Vibrio chagasii]
MSAHVTDADDDLATVKFFANDSEVCSLDENDPRFLL